MQTFDDLHLSTRYHGDRPTAGNFPHVRRQLKRPTTRIDRIESEAPKSLPLNFYDETWLANQIEEDRDALNVLPAFDLRIPKRITE